MTAPRPNQRRLSAPPVSATYQRRLSAPPEVPLLSSPLKKALTDCVYARPVGRAAATPSVRTATSTAGRATAMRGSSSLIGFVPVRLNEAGTIALRSALASDTTRSRHVGVQVARSDPITSPRQSTEDVAHSSVEDSVAFAADAMSISSSVVSTLSIST